jgi:hypothetical protein
MSIQAPFVVPGGKNLFGQRRSGECIGPGASINVGWYRPVRGSVKRQADK